MICSCFRMRRCAGSHHILGDKGYDADWFRKALAERGTTAGIPSKSDRKAPIEYGRMLYRQRHKIENMFDRSRTGTHPHALRLMRPYNQVSNLHRLSRHLLAMINES